MQTVLMSNRFSSVWDAIEDTPEQAAQLRARAQLLRKLQELIRSCALTPVEVARRLGVTQPRVSDLMRGRIHLFSLDTLIGMLKRLDVQVTFLFEDIARI